MSAPPGASAGAGANPKRSTRAQNVAAAAAAAKADVIAKIQSERTLPITFPGAAYSVMVDPSDVDFFPDALTADEAKSLLLRTKLQIDVLQADMYMHYNGITPDNFGQQYAHDEGIDRIFRAAPGGPLLPSAALAMEAIDHTKPHPVVYFQHVMRVWGEMSIYYMLGQAGPLYNHLQSAWPLHNTLVSAPANVPLRQHILDKIWPEFIEQAIITKVAIKSESPAPDKLREELARIMNTGDKINKQYYSAFNWIYKYGSAPKIADLERSDFYGDYDKLKTYLMFNNAMARSFFALVPVRTVDKLVTNQYKVNVALNEMLLIPQVCKLPNGKPVPYPSVFVQARTLEGRIRINAKKIAAANGRSLLAEIPRGIAQARQDIDSFKTRISDQLRTSYETDAVQYYSKIKGRCSVWIAQTMEKMKSMDTVTVEAEGNPLLNWGYDHTMQFYPLVYETGDTYGLERPEYKMIFAVTRSKALTTAQETRLQIADRAAGTVHADADAIEISSMSDSDWIDYVTNERDSINQRAVAKTKAASDEKEAMDERSQQRATEYQERRERIKAKRADIDKFLMETAGLAPDKLWYDPQYGCVARSKEATDPTKVKMARDPADPTKINLIDWYNALSRDDCMLWMYMSQADDMPLSQVYSLLDIDKILSDLAYTEPTMGVCSRELKLLKDNVTDEYRSAVRKLIKNDEVLKTIPLLDMSPAEIWDGVVKTEILAEDYERFLDSNGNLLKNANEAAPSGSDSADLSLYTRDTAIAEDDVRELYKVMSIEWIKRQNAMEKLEETITKVQDEYWRPILQRYLVITPHDPSILPADPKDGQRFLASADGNGWTSGKVYMYAASTQTYKEYTSENDVIYKNKFASFLVAHKAVREATTFDVDDDVKHMWHPEDVANAVMEMNGVAVDDPPNFKGNAARIIKIAGRDYVHVILPQYALVAQDMLFEKERRKILGIKSAGDLLRDIETQNAEAAAPMEAYGEDVHVSADNLDILRRLAQGRQVDLTQAQLLGGFTDPSILTRVLANVPGVCGDRQKLTEIFRSLVGRDPAQAELDLMKCSTGSGGTGSGGGSGTGTGTGSGGGSGSGSEVDLVQVQARAREEDPALVWPLGVVWACMHTG